MRDHTVGARHHITRYGKDRGWFGTVDGVEVTKAYKSAERAIKKARKIVKALTKPLKSLKSEDTGPPPQLW